MIRRSLFGRIVEMLKKLERLKKNKKEWIAFLEIK